MNFVKGPIKLKGLKAPLPISTKSKSIKKDKSEVQIQKSGMKVTDEHNKNVPTQAATIEETKESNQSFMTESERKFRDVQMSRLKQKVEMKAPELMVSHRQKIELFNKKLANLPEHNDIPKVGPG